MKYTRNFNNFVNESAKSDKLVPLMVKAIEKVDDSLSYADLATAVATIIKEQYGDHNIAPFMKELHKQLGVKESMNEDEEVFMATNSLNKIIDDASELLDKIGEEEINLPAWIQDHITKAEECLNHANQGFYVEEGVDEMAKTDVHYKEIMAMYNSGSFAKKKVAVVLCKNPNASLKQIEDVLGDAGYEEMIEFTDALGIKESEFKGYLSGDAAEDIAKALSHYVKGIIKQPNDNYTYLHLKNKSDASKVIKTLKDIYGLEGTDGGKLFWPSPTVKFSNDEILEAKDSDTFVGNPGEDKRMVDIRAFRGSVKDLTDFIEDKAKASQVAEGAEIKSAKNKHGEEFKIGDQIIAPDKKSVKITGFMKGKDGHMKAMYNAGMFADVYNLDDVEKV